MCLPSCVPHASTALSEHRVGVELLFCLVFGRACAGGGECCFFDVSVHPPPFEISPPPLQSPPPPQGGNHHLGPESIENTRRQRKFLQGAEGTEADLHCDTMVQICGAPPPPHQGGNRHVVTPPPPQGGNRHVVTPPPPPSRGGPARQKGGDFKGRGGYRRSAEYCLSCFGF